MIANDLIKQALRIMPQVKGLASEEEIRCRCLPAIRKVNSLVLFDPLDGSSNIDVNVTVGTIFSVLQSEPGADPTYEATYLQCGREQVAAGLRSVWPVHHSGA